MKLVFLWGFFFILGPLGANQVHFETMTWEELDASSYWVAKVTRENLKWEPLKLPVPGKDAVEEGKPIPDWETIRYRFKILEVRNPKAKSSALSTQAPALVPGTLVEVFQASAGLDWSLHQRYYLEGLVKSPVVLWLQSSLGNLDQGPWPKEFVVVLLWIPAAAGQGPRGWHLAVDNAWESLDKFPKKP